MFFGFLCGLLQRRSNIRIALRGNRNIRLSRFFSRIAFLVDLLCLLALAGLVGS
jgi:hypothetical protein